MKLLKFYADWCRPCTLVSNWLSNRELNVPLEEINIDNNLEMVRKYNIRSIPALILVDEEGNEKQRVTGFDTKKLEELLAGT